MFVPEESFELQLLCSLRRPEHCCTSFVPPSCRYNAHKWDGGLETSNEHKSNTSSLAKLVDSLVAPHFALSSSIHFLLPNILCKARAVSLQKISGPSEQQNALQRSRCVLEYLDSDLFCLVLEFVSPLSLFGTFGSLSSWWFASIQSVTVQTETVSSLLPKELFSLKSWKKLYLLFLRPVFDSINTQSSGISVANKHSYAFIHSFLDTLTTSIEVRKFLSCSGVLFASSLKKNQFFERDFATRHGVLSFPAPLSFGDARRVIILKSFPQEENQTRTNQQNWNVENAFYKYPFAPLYLYMPISMLFRVTEGFQLSHEFASDMCRLFFAPLPSPPLALPSHRFSVDLLECLPLYLKFLKRSSLRWATLRDFMQTNKMFHLIDRCFCFITMLQDYVPSSSSPPPSFSESVDSKTDASSSFHSYSSTITSPLYATDSVLIGLHILLLDNKLWYQIAFSKLGYLPKIDFGLLLKWNANKNRSVMEATAQEFKRRFGYGDYLEGEGKPCQQIIPLNEPAAVRLRWKAWFSGVEQLGVKRLAQTMTNLCDSSFTREEVSLEKSVQEYTATFVRFGLQRREYLLQMHKLQEEFRLARAREAAMGTMVVVQKQLILPSIAVPALSSSVDIVFHLHLLHSNHFYYDCMRELGLCVIHNPCTDDTQVDESCLVSPKSQGLCSAM